MEMQGGGVKRKPDAKGPAKGLKVFRREPRTKEWHMDSISNRNFEKYMKEKQPLFQQIAQVFGNPEYFNREDFIDGECKLILTSLHDKDLLATMATLKNWPNVSEKLEKPITELAEDTKGIDAVKMEQIAKEICAEAHVYRQKWMINCLEQYLKSNYQSFNTEFLQIYKNASKEYPRLNIAKVDGDRVFADFKDSIEDTKTSGLLPDFCFDIEQKFKIQRGKRMVKKTATANVKEIIPKILPLFRDIINSYNVDSRTTGVEAVANFVETMERRAKSQHLHLLGIEECLEKPKGSKIGTIGQWVLMDKLDDALQFRPLDEVDPALQELRQQLKAHFRKYDLFRTPTKSPSPTRFTRTPSPKASEPVAASPLPVDQPQNSPTHSDKSSEPGSDGGLPDFDHSPRSSPPGTSPPRPQINDPVDVPHVSPDLPTFMDTDAPPTMDTDVATPMDVDVPTVTAEEHGTEDHHSEEEEAQPGPFKKFPKIRVWPEDSVEGVLINDPLVSVRVHPSAFKIKLQTLFDKVKDLGLIHPVNSHVYPQTDDVYLMQGIGTDEQMKYLDGLYWNKNTSSKQLKGELPNGGTYKGEVLVSKSQPGITHAFTRHYFRIEPGNYILHWWSGLTDLKRANPSYDFGDFVPPPKYSHSLDKVKETAKYSLKKMAPHALEESEINEFDLEKHEDIEQSDTFSVNPATPYRHGFFNFLQVEDLEHFVECAELIGTDIQHCKKYCPVDPKAGEVYLFDISGASTEEFRQYTASDTYTWVAEQPRQLENDWVLYKFYNRDNTKTTASKKNCSFGKRLYENLTRDYGIIQYIGDEKQGVRQPHGNSKKKDKFFFRQHPSVRAECQELDPEYSGEHALRRINRDKRPGLMGEIEKAKNVQQVIYNRVDAAGLRERTTTDEMRNLLIACQIAGKKVVRRTTTYPHHSYMLITEASKKITEYIVENALKEDQPLLFSYDATFNLQDRYYGTALCMSNPMVTHLRNKAEDNVPAIYPIGILLHEKRPKELHDEFIEMLKTNFPCLETTANIVVSDKEFKHLNFFKATRRALCWNHITKNVEEHVRKMGILGTVDDRKNLIKNMKSILKSSTERSYQEKIRQFFDGNTYVSTSGERDYPITPHACWTNPAFQEYYRRNVEEDLCKFAGRWYLEKIGFQNPKKGITSNISESFNHMFKSSTYSTTADISVKSPSQFLLDVVGFQEEMDYHMTQARYSASDKYIYSQRYLHLRQPYMNMPKNDNPELGVKKPRLFKNMRAELIHRVKEDVSASKESTFKDTEKEPAEKEDTNAPKYKTESPFYPHFQKVEDRASRILEDDEKNITKLRGIGGFGSKQVLEPTVSTPFVVSTKGTKPTCTCSEVGMCPHILAVLASEGDRNLDETGKPLLTPNDCNAITFFLNKHAAKSKRTGSKTPRKSDLIFSPEIESGDRRVFVKCSYSPPKKKGARTPKTPKVPKRTGERREDTSEKSARKSLSYDFGLTPTPRTRVTELTDERLPSVRTVIPIDGLQWKDKDRIRNTCSVDNGITICAVQRSDKNKQDLSEMMLRCGDRLLDFAIKNLDNSSRVQEQWAAHVVLKTLEDTRIEPMKKNDDLFGSVSGRFLSVLNGFKLQQQRSCRDATCEAENPHEPTNMNFITLQGNSMAETLASYAEGEEATQCGNCKKEMVILGKLEPLAGEDSYGLVVEVDMSPAIRLNTHRDSYDFVLGYMENEIEFNGHTYSKAGVILGNGSHFVAFVQYDIEYYYYDGTGNQKHKFQEISHPLLEELHTRRFVPDKVVYLKNDRHTPRNK